MSGKTNTAWLQTMIKKYGSREAVQAHMQAQGSKGGKNGHTGGFASDKVGKDGLTGEQRAMVAGFVGGTRSRRRKQNEN